MASRKGMDGQGVAASPRPLQAIDRERREKEYRRRRNAGEEGKRRRETEKRRQGMKKNNLGINRFGKTFWGIFITRRVRRNSCARHGEREQRFRTHSSLKFPPYGSRKHLGPASANWKKISRRSRDTRD